MKATEGGHWHQKKKTEAVMTWLATGNLVTTASIIGVPHDTIKHWRKQPWWQEAVDAFYADDKQELDAKYQKIIRKALDVVDDRLTNGNFQLDQKTGKVIRVPVSIGDSHRVMKDLVDQQQVLRQDKPVQQIQAETVNDKLINLAKQFAEMAMKKEVVPQGTTYEMEQMAIEVTESIKTVSEVSEGTPA